MHIREFGISKKWQFNIGAAAVGVAFTYLLQIYEAFLDTVLGGA